MTWKSQLQALLRSAALQTLRITEPKEQGADCASITAAPTDLSTDSNPTGYEVSARPGERTPTWVRHYKILRRLGTGGMGSAVLAERLSDSVLVCLKFFSPKTDRVIAEQECRALMRLRHPLIVSLLDFSLDDDPPWLAMEYAHGSTLKTCLEEHGPFSPREVSEILKQILEALQHAHSKGVIHRDLKPANLVLDTSENPPKIRILDFGIAIVDGFDFKGNFTGTGLAAGTLLYMAPEQLDAKLLTVSCDLYSTGLVAWEMLTGQPAFKSLSEIVIQKLTSTEGLKYTDDTSQVAIALGAFIEACTRPDPKDRPSAQAGLATFRKLVT